MRQGQQNRRGRGRGRKPQNPLSRNIESNGPDVKIRGTAAHVAEKYMTLARDAMLSGDIVTAENYFQHAEHYNRMIAAAQTQHAAANPQAGQSGDGANGAGQRGRPKGGQDAPSSDPAAAAPPTRGNGRPPAKKTDKDAAGGGSGDAVEAKPKSKNGVVDETASSPATEMPDGSKDTPPDGASA